MLWTISFLFAAPSKGMAGKINDEQMFEMEKKLKKIENIVNAMTEEERANPDLLATMVSKSIWSSLIAAVDAMSIFGVQ